MCILTLAANHSLALAVYWVFPDRSEKALANLGAAVSCSQAIAVIGRIPQMAVQDSCWS